MSSEDLRKSQRDAVAAIQQLRALSPSAAQALTMQGGLSRPEDEPVVRNAAPVASEQYLVFTLADCELAIKAELVQSVERVIELTPVPNVAAWVLGVINLRGSITSVVDLRMFLALEQLPYTPRTRLLSLQYNEMVICFVVDGVNEMLPIPPGTIISGNIRPANIPQWALPYAVGSALLAQRMMVILDVPRLLFSEKMQHYKTLG
ncbi:MAG TPA: chemotaxis protein CheW [Ktedonobacteraceae bacterium]|nr:chemotaxis protein CheW [Ktedonobacteraceae bacterium]